MPPLQGLTQWDRNFGKLTGGGLGKPNRQDRPRVRVRLRDGRAGEADEARVRQSTAHVSGETVDEVILRAVHFVGDHDDVLALRQRREPSCLRRRRRKETLILSSLSLVTSTPTSVRGEKLLDGGEDHAAAGHGQQLAQLVRARSLHGRLAEDVRAVLELAEKLVIETVAVGQHHQRRVLHRRMPHHSRGEEEHGETLAAPLRVPDHPRATVARLAAVHPATQTFPRSKP